MNYTVFDVETANNQRDSICSIGFIRYENGQIVHEEEILINPEVEFNYFNIKIHGITQEMVRNKPTFSDIWPEIKQYFSDTILVAHNAKSMDLNALYKTLERYQLPLVENQYICTYELAREIFRNNDKIESYRLNVLSKALGIELKNHHNALEDTQACFYILQKFMSDYPNYVKPEDYYYASQTREKKACNINSIQDIYCDSTKAMQKLQLLVMDIMVDNQITDTEVLRLQSWLQEHDSLKGFYPFDKIFETVEDILHDKVMNKEEEQLLLKLLDAFVNPQTDDVQIDLNGKLVCLSGEFNYGSKKQVEAYMVSKGAIIAKSVTEKLNILILGEAGSAAWKYGNYGSKYERVQQINEKGKNIVVLKENDVFSTD